MNETAGATIRVSTEELILFANEANEKIVQMRKLLETVNRIVNSSQSFWEGDGQTAYLRAWQAGQGKTEEILARMLGHVDHVRMIAGVYEKEEREVEEKARLLPADIFSVR